MKIRKFFVSNSSSSSFIVINNTKNIMINHMVLPKEIKEELKSDYSFDMDHEVCITRHISDSDEYDVISDYDDTDAPSSIECYVDGGHGGPYDEERFVEIKPGIWLLKKHYPKGYKNESKKGVCK